MDASVNLHVIHISSPTQLLRHLSSPVPLVRNTLGPYHFGLRLEGARLDAPRAGGVLYLAVLVVVLAGA